MGNTTNLKKSFLPLTRTDILIKIRIIQQLNIWAPEVKAGHCKKQIYHLEEIRAIYQVVFC